MQSAQRPHPASAIGIGLHRLHGLHTVDLQRVRLDRQTALLQKRAEVVGLELFIGKLLVHESCEYLIFCLSKVSKQLAAPNSSEVDPGAVVWNPKVCGVDLRLIMFHEGNRSIRVRRGLPGWWEGSAKRSDCPCVSRVFVCL